MQKTGESEKKYLCRIITAVLAAGLWTAQAGIGHAASTYSPIGGGSAGRQLQDMREQMERERVEQELAEHREKTTIEDNQKKAEEQGGSIEFLLNEVVVDESAVLPAEKRDEIIKPYIGKIVTVNDLYKIVADINAFYAENQYLTCRAYLLPQTIHDGVVHISLIEGRNGEVFLKGNRHTRASYITDRVHVKKGEIESMAELAEKLRRFNGTNDVQLRVSLKAGAEAGTTDYVLTAREPQNSMVTIYTDNAGSETTGDFRTGLFYANRSLFGDRDALSLGWLRSRGMDSGNVNYSVPVGRSGTRLSAFYSSNGTKVVKGQYKDWDIPVRGHASSYSFTLTQPIVVKDNSKIEASFGWQKMHSVTDIAGIQMIDDVFTDYTAALAMTFYGNRSAFYQKHSFTHGDWDNQSELSRIAKPSADYNIYNFTGIFQQGAAHGQLFTFRTNVQCSFTDDLRPSKQFFIGGVNTVRGYKENTVGGDSGCSLSLEYSVPVTKDRALSMYGFLDYGTLWGDALAEHHTLSSAGVGLRAKIKALSLDLCLGFPMKRDLDGNEKVDSMRLNFVGSLRF